MDANGPEMDALEQSDQPESWPFRKRYTAPRLTKHGSIVTHTATGPVPGGSAIIPSDRALKDRLAPVDPGQVLARVAALPMVTWSYKGDTVRHLGPMAQDFSAAFGLGADDRHIHTVDASGVALAALQGLHALVQAQAARLAALERELAVLRAGRGDEHEEVAPGDVLGRGVFSGLTSR